MNQPSWTDQAVRLLMQERQRSADTHLLRVELPTTWPIDLYLKDESTHPTGSLKHRLALSLFLYGVCSGRIEQGTPIIEASSGSTAISEAYFARLLGLPFIAVVPASTTKSKIEEIESYGGTCHFVDTSPEMYPAAERLADELGGYYMDQFGNAATATDWRGNNNIAESIFDQMQFERFPEPSWIVVGAGTGGTSATVGRYIRYKQFSTSLCVVDPEASVFFDVFVGKSDLPSVCDSPPIEGIGRPRAEPSFLPQVVDRMLKIPNLWSLAAMIYLQRLTKRCFGPSTGTNFAGMLVLAFEAAERGESGSMVTLGCDAGSRYTQTYYDTAWQAERGYQVEAMVDALARDIAIGKWSRVLDFGDVPVSAVR